MRCYRLGKRRITASSRSNGRFVAPRIRIRWLSLDLRPSQAAINSFRILLVASCSNAPPLAPSKLSTYNNRVIPGGHVKPSYVEPCPNFSPSNENKVLEYINTCFFFHFSKRTSSTNMITGASRLAKEKRAFVSFSASPNHCLRKKLREYLVEK